MASAAIAWSAIRISVPTCVGQGFGLIGGSRRSCPSRLAILSKPTLLWNSGRSPPPPLTDAGMTPYRGIKKLRDAGALGPNRIVGVLGIGGLGGYAVQYAKLLGGGATVVAFARNAAKLAVAEEYGVDHVINIKGKSPT